MVPWPGRVGSAWVIASSSRASLGGTSRISPLNDRAIVRDALVQQLEYQPAAETRHRKRMRPNTLAGWRLRVGGLRVYHDVLEEDALVLIQAVGVKRRSRVYVGGEEIDL